VSLEPHHPSKRLGQHFLKDLKIANAIVSCANLDSTDSVLEPGAGHGVLTRLLEAKASRVIAVEKDHRLVGELQREFSKSPSVEIIEGDVLKTRLPPFNRVVGTPPYNISSKLVLFLQGSHFMKAHLVFQKEFANRLLAHPGTSDYGRLSVTAQRTMTMHSLIVVSREAFTPKPKIDSVLVSFEPKPYRTDADPVILTDLVRGIFTQRRRLVRGALVHFLKLKVGREQARIIVSSLSLPGSRVYELSIRELEEIAIQLKPLLPPEPN
jgi:16S rRNA (adenine1518-N6/adenine1519-N6)-dimethyltransferase